MIRKNPSKMKGLEIKPANIPMASPIHPGIYLHKLMREITEPKITNMITAPTATCFALPSSFDSFAMSFRNNPSLNPVILQILL